MLDETAPREGLGEARPRTTLEPTVTVVIPTRNEAGNVDALVAALTDALDGVRAEVIFVDDSDDETPATVARAASGSRNLPIALIHRPAGERDNGLGGAVLAGLAAARGRYVCVMDGDLQHPPAVIHRLLAHADENELDLVLASRFANGSRVASLSAPRRAVSKTLIGATRLLFPRRLGSITDPLTGFFVVRRDAVDLTALRPDGFKILLEILLRTPGLRAGEVGFDFAERHAGTSKASLRELGRYARLVARLRIATAPKRLGAFALVGLTGIVVNTLALATFHGLGLGTGLLSLLLATQISSLWLFVLTDRLVFRDTKPERSGAARLVAFMAVNTSALLIRGPLYLVLHKGFGMHYLVANLISICALTLVRFVIADRVLWREREDRTFRYSVHDLVTISSPVALPELQRFQVDSLDAPPQIEIGFGKVPSLPCGMGFSRVEGHDRLSYRERAGFSVVYDFDDTTKVTVNPFLGHSPHVLYTNCAEPLLRWKFAELGFALVHAACVAQGNRAYLITARTDTGKTTTILKALDHDASLGFISDDLTLVHPDGRVLSYPKPLTISQHTLHAVRTPNLTRNQRLALVVQARLHSRGGRSIGMALFRMGLPAATMNSVIQWMIPPPKYDVETLIPTVDVVEQAQLSGMVVIERGGEGSIELEPQVALETLLENCDDAYGFPPYPVIHELLHGRRAADLQAAERTTVERAISGHTTLLLRSSTMDWWQRLPQIMGAAGVPRVAPNGGEPAVGLLEPPRLALEADAVE